MAEPSESSEKQTAANQAASPKSLLLSEITFAALGLGLGIAYGTLPKITDLSMGPVPGSVVGGAFGAAFGFFLGAFVGAAGSRMLTPRAALGFLIGAALFVLGRLSDDTGQWIDKIMDMVVAGTFYGIIGALIGAVLFDPKAPPLTSDTQPQESPAKSKPRGGKK